MRRSRRVVTLVSVFAAGYGVGIASMRLLSVSGVRRQLVELRHLGHSGYKDTIGAEPTIPMGESVGDGLAAEAESVTHSAAAPLETETGGIPVISAAPPAKKPHPGS